MNRIWFGAALLAALLFVGIGSGMMMEQIHRPPAADLIRASELALEGNWKGADNFAAAARRGWDKRRNMVAALTEHGPMDQIEGLFAQLEVYGKTQDAASFGSTCRYLASQLEALGRSHSFNLQNLF